MISAVAIQSRYKLSRYAFSFPTKQNGSLLYSSFKGGVAFIGAPYDELFEALSYSKPESIIRIDDKLILDKLLSLGIIVPDDFDELKAIRKKYLDARKNTPMTLTLTTTQDCNLGCYYCYESRTKDKLTDLEISEIVRRTRSKLETGKHSSLHVDWYGGEPFLNFQFIESCSMQLQDLCEQLGINYHASAISNGTLWPKNAAEFVKKHKFRQVQISFDGVYSHNSIRRYRKQYQGAESGNSFQIAFDLIGELLEATQVDVRFNVSRRTMKEIGDFTKLVNNSDWFNKPFPCFIQPARVSMYSEKSSFVRDSELSQSEFESVLTEFREGLGGDKHLQIGWFADGIGPKNNVCAALADDSFVVGAEKLIYRCGLQVGEKERAVGSIEIYQEKNTTFGDSKFWDEFDPTVLPDCKRCSFLPICWGGCPKKHLEKDFHNLHETSLYYRKNLAKEVAKVAGIALREDFEISENQQFRD